LVILEIGSWFSPRLAWTTISNFILSTLARKTGLHHCYQFFFHWDGVLQTVLPGLDETHNLQISVSHVAWDDRHTPLCPGIGWDGVSLIFFQGWPQTRILWLSASQVARITGIRHGNPAFSTNF
jgi:hypothetical protein